MHIDLLSSLRMCPAQVKSFRFFFDGTSRVAQQASKRGGRFGAWRAIDGSHTTLPGQIGPVLLTVTSRTRVVAKFFCQEWTGVGMKGYE